MSLHRFVCAACAATFEVESREPPADLQTPCPRCGSTRTRQTWESRLRNLVSVDPAALIDAKRAEHCG